MRALGPGSVSSFLKTVLDVVYYVLLVIGAAALLGMVAALILSFDSRLLGSKATIDGLTIAGPWMGPTLAALAAGVAAYAAGALVIVTRLRLVFMTMIAGDPFEPANAARLRIVGAALAALEVGRYCAALLIHAAFHGRLKFAGGIDLSMWFAVLSVFVLAEVFREGARLRREAELTI
jgi:Protein of unknown function (DUF2975)